MAEKQYKREDLSHPTIFHELLNSKLPPAEKSVLRLAEEAQTVRWQELVLLGRICHRELDVFPMCEAFLAEALCCWMII